MKKEYLNDEEALLKMQNYCSYQERCQEEARSKLIELGVYGDRLENIIADLILENFINEERFAAAFVGGKFRIKHWGKTKIAQELKAKRISDYCIKKALAKEIDPEDYKNTLIDILNKKAKLLVEPNAFKRKQKLAQYAMSRGFESGLIWDYLQEVEEDKKDKKSKK